jgi:hypothetical protein
MSRSVRTTGGGNNYHGTRVAVPSRNAIYSNQVLLTRVGQQAQPGTTRNLTHRTGYNCDVEGGILCRCANPNSHGDAFTDPESGERYDGIACRDTTGKRMTPEEEAHRALDLLGKDHANREELRSIESQLYDAATLQAKQQQHRNTEWAKARGLTRSGVPHDVIWHGRINPKRCLVMPAPETPGAVFIGPQGGYRPGPTASAQGTRLQGRATTLGYSWGASRINNQSTSSGTGRPERG